MVKKPKLTGANLVPIGFGSQNSTRKSIFDRIVFPGVSVFDRMGARQANLHDHSAFSSSLVHEPRINQASSVAHCSRCFASSHSRRDCKNAIKCSACLGWGHVPASCFHPRENLNAKAR
jgi:hypothetical protein